MKLEIFENLLGEWIYDMNNPLSLIVETEIKKKQQTNKDHQKAIKEKHQRFPKEHTEVLQWPQTREKTEMQNQRKTLDVGYATKAIRFQTLRLWKTCQYKKDAKQWNAKGCASIAYIAYWIPIKLVTVNQRYHVKSKKVERDTTPFSTMLATNHPPTTLIQQLIAKTSINKKINKINK